MREKDRRARVQRGIDDDVAEREVDAAGVAAMMRDMEAARLRIEMRNPQAFMRRIGFSEAAGEKRRAAATSSTFSGSSAR